MLPPSITRARVLGLALAVLLSLGAGGCGDSDDGGSDSGGSSSTSESQSSTGGGDKAQATAAVNGLYAAIREGDAEGVCDSLTAAGQKQVAGGGLGGKSDTCTDAFQKFLDAAERQGGLNLTLKAKVEKMKVNGDKAVASVSFGDARRGKIPLVKQDGEWKIEQAGAQ